MISPQEMFEMRKFYAPKSSSPTPAISESVSYTSSPSTLLVTQGTTDISDDITDNRDQESWSVDLRREEERLKTFEKWPLKFLDPKVLAKNGFYYLGRGDEVRCAFCRVEIMRWEEGDDPADDHQRWAPQCPFLKKHASAGNVPIDSSTSAGRDECGTREAPSAVRMPRPVHLHYSTEAARLNSFKDWPRSMRQKPEELSEAGFFYTGHGDKTKCFYCDGGLKDWEDNDVPWEQHAMWFDRCPYVQLVKGKEYIQKIKTEACLIRAPKQETNAPKQDTKTPSPVTIPQAQTEEIPIAESKLCKICYCEEHNIVFIPCGHVVACAKCALSTNSCPMCRKPIENVVRLYFS